MLGAAGGFDVKLGYRPSSSVARAVVRFIEAVSSDGEMLQFTVSWIV
jgi:hypothetical protein